MGCGCGGRSKARRLQGTPGAPVSLPQGPTGTEALYYLGTNPREDVADVPTGARYAIRRSIVRVFTADVDTLRSRANEDGTALFLNDEAYTLYRMSNQAPSPISVDA